MWGTLEIVHLRLMLMQIVHEELRQPYVLLSSANNYRVRAVFTSTYLSERSQQMMELSLCACLRTEKQQHISVLERLLGCAHASISLVTKHLAVRRVHFPFDLVSKNAS